ncbi:MAG: hypothetical protein ACF8PN_08695 [Phycisphaerales bacterium]
MKFPGRAIGFGALLWLVVFVIAFAAFPLREQARPVFESIMSVAVALATVVFGVIYLRRIERDFVREGVALGAVWLVISIAIDAPLMLLGGPMQMTVAEYFGDIGLTYLGIPIITTGLGWMAARRSGG